MTKLKQVGMAGMLVASLTAGSGPALASATVSRPPRPVSNATARKSEAAIYQQRLSFLAKALETDTRQLELKLTQLANRQQIN